MAKPDFPWEVPDQWSEWSERLSAGLHACIRWRLPVLLLGILFANGRRTVTNWLRAAGISDEFDDYYYLLAAVGRQTNLIVTGMVALVLRTLPLPKRRLLIIDDSPTQRSGPKVEAADIPSESHTGACPSGVPVWSHLGDDFAGAAASPVGCAGVALASDALRAQEDHGSDFPWASLAAVRDQTPTCRAAGGVDRSPPDKSEKNWVSRLSKTLWTWPTGNPPLGSPATPEYNNWKQHRFDRISRGKGSR